MGPHGLWRTCLAALLALPPAQAPRDRAYDPTSAYEARVIEGFTVLVNRRLLGAPEEAREALGELGAQLKEVVRVVPPAPLARLREVRIWVERAARPDKAAEFHPSEAWLRDNGYNPEKAGGVEIANARNFVAWSRSAQPWAAFHELAHAYHFRVLGAGDAAVLDAYRGAMTGHLYDSVAYVLGGRRRAYAAVNAKEYFAELSEAYLGRNDFFPFDRAELKAHDPAGFRLMERVWGPPRDAQGFDARPPHQAGRRRARFARLNPPRRPSCSGRGAAGRRRGSRSRWRRPRCNAPRPRSCCPAIRRSGRGGSGGR